jgi:Tol biopolymer transport system component
MQADGTGSISDLTSDFWGAFLSTYTPDGSRMTFNSTQGGFVSVVWIVSTPVTPIAVFRMNLDGRGLTKLSDPGKGHHDIPGTYSPDGTKIVFASDRLSNNLSLDLFIMNGDGSDIHRIASGLTVGGCPDGNCVTPSWGPTP